MYESFTHLSDLLVSLGEHGPDLFLCHYRIKLMLTKSSLIVNLITDDPYCLVLAVTVFNIFSLQRHKHTLKKILLAF